MGNGFFQIITKSEAVTQKILMLSPHISKWGTSILQPWVGNFDPLQPKGMKMPVWITFRGVKDEFISSAQDLAQGIGTVLGRHRGNETRADQKFCVAVETGKPFVVEIDALNPVNEEVVKIQVDYNNLPIRCRLCLSTSHLIKDCPRAYGNHKPYLSRGVPQEGSEGGTIERNGREGNEMRSYLPGRRHASVQLPQRVVGGWAAPPNTHLHSTSEEDTSEEVDRDARNQGRREAQQTPTREPRPNQGTPTHDHTGHRIGVRSIDYGRWLSRERERGYESSPNSSEFSDINEFFSAKNF